MNRELLDNIRQVFLDMDGTIYRGTTLFDCTLPFLAFLRSKNIGYAFLSNNSSISTAMYVEKLRKMGIEATPDNFYTSTHYAIDYLKENLPTAKKLYLLAIPEVRAEFEAAGFVFEEKDPDAFVLAFDKTLTYEKMCKGAYFMRKGVPSIATHPDVFCPTDKEEWLVDCGAMIAALETSTGVKMKVLGKPDPGLLTHAAHRRNITDMKQCLMIGDRLSTDVAVGINSGSVACHIVDPNSEINPVKNITPHFAVKDLAELQKIWQS